MSRKDLIVLSQILNFVTDNRWEEMLMSNILEHMSRKGQIILS